MGIMQKFGDLFVNVSAKGVGQTNAALGTTEKKASMASKATNMLATAIVAIGSYAVINAIRSVINEFTDYTVKIDKFTKQTGIATDTIQKLVYAAEQEHGNLESLNKGLMNLTVRLGYAGDGLETYLRYFRALGIEYKNADGTLRDTYDVFLDLADVVSRGELSTEKLAAVMQLFGARSAKELIPLLKKGRDWFEEMGIEAENLGIVLDDLTVKQGKEFSDQITRLGGAVKGLKYAIAADLIPTLIELANTVESLKPLYNLFKEFDKYFRAEIGGWSLNLINLNAQFKNLYKVLKSLNLIKEVGKDIGELEPIIISGKGPLDDFGKSAGDAAAAMRKLWRATYDWNLLMAANDEARMDMLEGMAKEKETGEELDVWLEAYLATQGKVKDETEKTSTSIVDAAAVLNVLGNSFGNLNGAILNNAAAFRDWAGETVIALMQVIIKLMALGGIVKMLDALGVPAGALLKLGSKFGLFQTPTGDMFAYREGLDFGKLFFGGMQERFNSMIANVSGMQRQQPMNIIIHTGDPSTFVEFASGMPFNQKTKFYKDVTREVEDRL